MPPRSETEKPRAGPISSWADCSRFDKSPQFGENRRMPKSPEQWLEHATPPEKKAGVFKLFLGYAPGVGKTFNMLSEAIRRSKRGEDVVIGIVETHGRKGIAELAAQLETIPRRKMEYKGTIFEEMDLDAILARKPQAVLVDKLSHTNVEGCKPRKRLQAGL